jgi:hypothetical protein
MADMEVAEPLPMPLRAVLATLIVLGVVSTTPNQPQNHLEIGLPFRDRVTKFIESFGGVCGEKEW